MEVSELLKKYEKIYILNISLPGAGFGAIILTTLSQLRYCERQNYYPVVNYNSSCKNAFFDPEYGDNLWLQYFEPVMPVDFAAIQKALESGELKKDDCLTISRDEMLKIAEEHPDSVYSFPFGKWRYDQPEDLSTWYDQQRRKGRETISKYVRLKPHITEKLATFQQQYFQNNYVLGVHIRGTDLHYAPPVAPAEYFGQIDQQIAKHPNLKIFLATDQRQYIAVFEERYGDRLCYLDIFRSDNEVAPFNRTEISPYTKGEDVLLDIILLSKSDFLLKGASNVSEMAIYFNPELTFHDLALEKDKAFGEDYGKGWDNLTNKPAWSLLKDKNLHQIADDATSQSLVQHIKYRIRFYISRVLFLLKKR